MAELIKRDVNIFIWGKDKKTNAVIFTDMFKFEVEYEHNINNQYKTHLELSDFVDEFNNTYKANINHNALSINHSVKIPYLYEIFIHKKDSLLIYSEHKLRQRIIKLKDIINNAEG